VLKALQRLVLRGLSLLFSDRLASAVARVMSRRFVEQLRKAATDDFVELLLHAMDVTFCLSRSYRRNIDGFSARYVFATADGSVGATASFEDGDMSVSHDAADEWTARVEFTSPAALRRFLLSENADIIQSILDNEVKVDGNINYIYKLGFMVRDLQHRLGVDA
jgi:hypothetical protein